MPSDGAKGTCRKCGKPITYSLVNKPGRPDEAARLHGKLIPR